ncbi:MAG: phosphohistidine phosphatase SixA [Polyangiaceae bacterium]|nr:phosphohistidine phosphatase SixA [Polyangiaceae bacterium]
MMILLFRHGQAIDETPGLGDAARALTGKGRKATRKMSRWLARRGSKLRPTEVWTSPLVRAVQTAEIAAEALGLSDEVSVHAELMPGASPDDLLKKLAEHRSTGPLMLVGHEPSMSAIAAQLLGERSYPGLKKSGILAVEWEGHGPGHIHVEKNPSDL